MYKRYAFTLIELLVVIAIIALLLAILMPTLQRAKKQTKAVICLHNLKQWGLATSAYAAEWDDRLWCESYPRAGAVTTTPGDWMATLRPYFQTTGPKFAQKHPSVIQSRQGICPTQAASR